MNRTRIFFAVFSIMAFAVASSCKGRNATPDLPKNERPAEQALEAPAENAHSSYDLILADASLAPFALEHPERPFPQTAVVGEDSLDLLYGENEAGYSFRPYGAKGGSVAAQGLRFDVGAPREARRGKSVYRIEGKSLVASVEGAGAEANAQRTWDSNHFLVAGPIVFQDRILVATDAPSFVALDRATLAPVFERPMDALARGPLIFLAKPRLLAALHADGSVGLYTLEESATGAETVGKADSEIDPVSALVDPPAASVAAMEAKTASLMGRDGVKFPPVQLYGPEREVSGTDPLLFRMDADEKGGPMRLYLDGALTRPYLVAAFNASGEYIKSNIDYMGAEHVLEQRLEPKATYFFAVAFLSDSEPSEGATEKQSARFTIVPKK